MANKLRPDELSAFKEAFDMFDKNQDGTISTKVRFDLFLSWLEFLEVSDGTCSLEVKKSLSSKFIGFQGWG